MATATTEEVTALVTAGGTRDLIDDVRVHEPKDHLDTADLPENQSFFITNISGGHLGLEIARALEQRRVATTFLASKRLHERERLRYEPFSVLGFSSFVSLRDALNVEFRSGPPDIVFMAAAVADFGPTRIDGKTRSDAGGLHLDLPPNEKLLAGFREVCGTETFLVGFKFLSGATRTQLLADARRQLQTCRLNLVVANDLRQIHDGQHPIIVVTPEGGAIDMIGTKHEVAEQLVDFVLRRYHVRWSHSERRNEVTTVIRETDVGFHGAAELLTLAQDMGLLSGRDGNVSFRSSAPSDHGIALWTTPRQVEKATCTSEDLLATHADLDQRHITYRGREDRKPSIDTAVHAWLYEQLPGITGLLHFHHGLVLPDAKTTFPYPCGTHEEAEEIFSVLMKQAALGSYAGGAFGIELTEHGYLIGVEPNGPERLANEWRIARDAYVAHLEEIGRSDAAADLRARRGSSRLSPIFASASIVGVRLEETERDAISCFLLPNVRSKGYGEHLIDRLIDAKRNVIVDDRCEVLEYYYAHGYRLLGRSGSLVLLEPPSVRTDLKNAASVCLYNPITRRVLPGLRLTDPWKGYHSWPGGREEPGENPLETAIRELREETGIPLRYTEPHITQIVYTGTADGTRAFRVTNFIFLTVNEPTPKRSIEMDARWMSIDEALALRPMGAGTRKILRSLAHVSRMQPRMITVAP